MAKAPTHRPPHQITVTAKMSSMAWSHIPGVFHQVKPQERVARRFTGWQVCTEVAFVCVHPTHVLLGPFLSLTSLSVPRPVRAGRLDVMTPFFLRALWGLSNPLTFTQLSLRSLGYSYTSDPQHLHKKHKEEHTQMSSRLSVLITAHVGLVGGLRLLRLDIMFLI